MKQLKLLLLGVVSALLMLFVVFVPMRANAAVIENGVPNALQREGSAFYKMTLDVDSLVEISWAKNNNLNANIAIYMDKNKTDCLLDDFVGSKSGTISVPLKRGTYYVDMYDGATGKAPTTKVKFAWTPATKYDRENYSLFSAYELKPDVPEEIVQIRTCAYTRWYKIKLTKNQKITISVKNPFFGVYPSASIEYPFHMTRFYDSKLKPMFFSYEEYYGNGNLVSQEVCPKGTYYIVVSNYEVASPAGEYMSITWK